MTLTEGQRDGLRRLTDQLNGELARGTYVMTRCRCQRMLARAGRCVLCLVDEIELWKICAESGAKNQETEDNKGETK